MFYILLSDWDICTLSISVFPDIFVVGFLSNPKMSSPLNLLDKVKCNPIMLDIEKDMQSSSKYSQHQKPEGAS